MTHDELMALAPDDVVLVSGSGLDRNRSLVSRVDRVTQTMIIVTYASTTIRFSRKTGQQIGGNSFHPLELESATPVSLTATRRANLHDRLQREIRGTQWGKLSLEQLESIAQIIKSPKE